MQAVPRYIDQRQYLTLFNSKWGPVDLIKSAVFGFNYTDLTDLTRQIKEFFEKEDKGLQQVLANNRDWLHTQKPLIDKIVFDCHGNTGLIYLNSSKSEPLKYTNAHPYGYPGLNELVELMTLDGTIMFLSCVTGRGLKGTQLMVELSNLFKNKQIISFSVSNAGVLPATRLESPHGVISLVDPLTVARITLKLKIDLPPGYPLHTARIKEDKQLKRKFAMRLDAESPYAKIAYNGYITKVPLYDADYTKLEAEFFFLRRLFRIILMGDGTPSEKATAQNYLDRHPNSYGRFEALSKTLELPTEYVYEPFIGSPLEN